MPHEFELELVDDEISEAAQLPVQIQVGPDTNLVASALEQLIDRLLAVEERQMEIANALSAVIEAATAERALLSQLVSILQEPSAPPVVNVTTPEPVVNVSTPEPKIEMLPAAREPRRRQVRLLRDAFGVLTGAVIEEEE